MEAVRPHSEPAGSAPSAFGVGLDAGPAFAEFGTAVAVVRHWPERTALVLCGNEAPYDRPHPQVLSSLHRFGFLPVVARVADAVDVAANAGPFTFLLLGPEVLLDPDGVSVVRTLAARNPLSRVLLLGAVEEHTTRGLVDGIRAGVTDVVDPADDIALTTMLSGQLKLAGERRERVLAIGAHPDDIEIGCAGTLLSHRRHGDRISQLTLSRVAVGGDDIARAAESIATAEAIGAQLRMADLPDTCTDAGVDTIRIIEAVVRAVDPTVVYEHSRHDNHQDHHAVYAAALSATRSVAQVFAYPSPSATNDFLPSKFVAIDDVIAEKVKLSRVFHSQRDRSYLEPELVVAGARYWARQLAPRTRHAEPFEVVRASGASTPRLLSTASSSRPADAAHSGHGTVTRLPRNR